MDVLPRLRPVGVGVVAHALGGPLGELVIGRAEVVPLARARQARVANRQGGAAAGDADGASLVEHVHVVEWSEAHAKALEGHARLGRDFLLELVLGVRGAEVDLAREEGRGQDGVGDGDRQEAGGATGCANRARRDGRKRARETHVHVVGVVALVIRAGHVEVARDASLHGPRRREARRGSERRVGRRAETHEREKRSRPRFSTRRRSVHASRTLRWLAARRSV